MNTGVLAFPMHGYSKLIAEGFRTRDGHIIEWLATTGTPVTVVSRPEPAFRTSISFGSSTAADIPLKSFQSRSWRIPHPTDRQHWWLRSARSYRMPGGVPEGTPAILWNPFVAVSPIADRIFAAPVLFDLLDDWTVHYAFEGIRSEVESAYRSALARAKVVTANSEGTLQLAERMGRPDAVLIPNGCDPERYSGVSSATGPTRVGYIGKLGSRIDIEGIVQTATALPDVEFVVAGPVLESNWELPMRKVPNITMLGDQHYSKIPDLLRTFDIGWVPHRVGAGEVGGDAIKIYEYRAAALPVVSTAIIGAQRGGIGTVRVAPMADHAALIEKLRDGGLRVPREPHNLPENVTWRFKTDLMRSLLLA